MGDLLVLEGANHVVDAIDVLDVTEKVVTQSLALRRPTHDTGNINNLQHGSNLRFRMVHVA